ncbi:carcinoembryonic antigen-related cell adhesion molecule 20 [Alosa sapidissima]|uniref:carcinoembryonic antigen-related cell adhesion molecule 20 n=1 Tax=Alosa sapidissima TaxID=34773 RepID=UPI001C084799|nr:carcinoembryonic antigen-related cell adhesion molecule 20 [Alosa sapidissima]
MDFFNFRLFFLLASAVVCCSADILKNDKVKGVLGKNVKFNTTFDGSEYLSLSWNFGSVNIVTASKDKVAIANAYKDRVKLNKTTGMMELGPLTAADNGMYQLIIVTQELQTLTGDSELKVLEPVSSATITSDPPKEAVESNSSVVLTCTAKGSFLKYTWLNNTVPVVADGKRLILNADGNILSVKDVQRWDLRGPIYCRAGNDLEEETSAAFNMTVSYGPEKVVLVQTPTSSVLATGAMVTLACSSVSSPDATYQWMHNGAPMKDTTASITLENVNEKNSGNYTCVAFNAKTKRYTASNMALFTVIEPIKGTTITRVGAATPLIAKDSSIQLTCKAVAGTVASTKWTKDGVDLVVSERVVLSKKMDMLNISMVQREDAGLYKCVLKNAVNSLEGNYTMVVNYGPEGIKMVGPKAVEITDRVEIKCTAESYPVATYSWKLNGTELEPTTSMFIIEQPSFRDTGTYTCTARNPLTNGTASSTHTLAVKEEGALDEGLSGGAIAGIIIGVLIALAIVIGVVMHMRKKKDIPSPY